VEVIRGWADHALDATHRHIHLHFHARPAALRGGKQVETVVVERTTVDDDGAAHGTGDTFDIDAQLVVRSVGYRGLPMPGVPFDARRNVIPNTEGRVVDEAGAPVPGLYVAGWIKRGPTGIIGTNKKDAAATVASLLADVEGAGGRGGDGVLPLLVERGVGVVDVEGWRGIDAAERALGESRGRTRTTLHERDTLVAAATRG
jgi:ferredoxin--NADP+ reductase